VFRFARRFPHLVALVATLTGLASGFSASAAHAATGTSSLPGSVFQDLNRNGARDAGESGFSGLYVDLLDSTGNLVQAAATDASGNYRFDSLADGTYRVQIEGGSWAPLSDSWTPTTTGSLYANKTVVVSGTGNGDIGVRPIVRSTNEASPISSFTAPSGVVVRSYDDVVTASQVSDQLSKMALLGAEAGHVAIEFDLGGQDVTIMSSGGSATVRLTFSGWLQTGDRVLDHEYGHAWSNYFATQVRNDPTFSEYLQVRGLTGNPMLNTSHAWDPKEMIAEDFRQLFGSTTGAAPRQENGDIPAAADVPGLRDYLSTTFRTAPAGGGTSGGTSGSTSGGSTTPPATTLTVSGLAMNPTTVTKSGTTSFSLSASASVTVRIVSSNGTVVRTLASNVARPSGASSYTWDRKDSSGTRVKSGSYTVRVTATNGSQTTDAASPFSVG
jgi:hypothetical protein